MRGITVTAIALGGVLAAWVPSSTRTVEYKRRAAILEQAESNLNRSSVSARPSSIDATISSTFTGHGPSMGPAEESEMLAASSAASEEISLLHSIDHSPHKSSSAKSSTPFSAETPAYGSPSTLALTHTASALSVQASPAIKSFPVYGAVGYNKSTDQSPTAIYHTLEHSPSTAIANLPSNLVPESSSKQSTLTVFQTTTVRASPLSIETQVSTVTTTSVVISTLGDCSPPADETSSFHSTSTHTLTVFWASTQTLMSYVSSQHSQVPLSSALQTPSSSAVVLSSSIEPTTTVEITLSATVRQTFTSTVLLSGPTTAPAGELYQQTTTTAASGDAGTPTTITMTQTDLQTTTTEQSSPTDVLSGNALSTVSSTSFIPSVLVSPQPPALSGTTSALSGLYDATLHLRPSILSVNTPLSSSIASSSDIWGQTSSQPESALSAFASTQTSASPISGSVHPTMGNSTSRATVSTTSRRTPSIRPTLRSSHSDSVVTQKLSTLTSVFVSTSIAGLVSSGVPINGNAPSPAAFIPESVLLNTSAFTAVPNLTASATSSSLAVNPAFLSALRSSSNASSLIQTTSATSKATKNGGGSASAKNSKTSTISKTFKTSTSSTASTTLKTSLTLKVSGTSKTSAATPTNTLCGESGNFTLTWDDEPEFTPSSNSTGAMFPPVFNPYHKLFFASGYGYMSDKAEDIYAAISEPTMAVWLSSYNDTDTGSPNAGAQGSNALMPGEIGAGPRAWSNLYWFNGYGAYFGCLIDGPGVCQLVVNGYTWDEDNKVELPGATIQQEIPTCPHYRNCSMTYVDFGNGNFEGLSGIQFQMFQVVHPDLSNPIEWRDFVMDSLSLGWYNNTCEAGLARISQRK